MSYCTLCGRRVEPGRFCTNCGASLEEQLRTDTAERSLTAVLELPPPPVYAEPAPPRAPRRAWPWWPTAVLVLVVLLVLAWTFGVVIRDDGAHPAGSTPADTVDLTRGAVATAPSTAPPRQDVDGDLVRYEPSYLLDGVPTTAWRMVGDGTGTTLTVRLASPSLVTRVGLINGYAKVDDEVDWYPRNRRVLEAEWIFDDGSSVVQHLEESSDLQSMEVGPIRTSTIRLRLLIVSRPGDRDYTAISDLLITGSPA